MLGRANKILSSNTEKYCFKVFKYQALTGILKISCSENSQEKGHLILVRGLVQKKCLLF